MAIETNYTITGTLIDNSGNVSGSFNSSNYITTTTEFNFSNYETFSITFPIRITVPYYGSVYPICEASIGNMSQSFLSFKPKSDGSMYVALGNNSASSSNIGTISASGLGGTPDVVLRLEFTGTAYILYWGTSEDNLTEKGRLTTSAKLFNGNTSLRLGGPYGYSALYNMNEFKVEADGEVIYTGREVKSAVKTYIQLRHDTVNNWSTVNPVLLDGEIALALEEQQELIPTTEFTSASTDGWVATCNNYSSEWSSNWYKVFDSTVSSGWYEGTSFGNPAWIQLKFPNELTLAKITLEQNAVSNSLSGNGYVSVIYSDNTMEQVGTFSMDSEVSKQYTVDFTEAKTCIGIRITVTSRLVTNNGVSLSTVRLFGNPVSVYTDMKIGDGTTAWNSLPYFMEGTVQSSSITNIVQISQADYDALTTKDTNTLYVIV